MKKEVYDHLGNKFESMQALCNCYGISTGTYRSRLEKLNWSLEKTLTTPACTRKKKITDHLGNEFPSIRALCDYYEITTTTYSSRVNKLGWSLEQALTTPTAQKEIASVDHLDNKFPSQNALCKHYKISAKELKHRINEMGWSLEKALTTPSKKSADNKVCDHEGREFESLDDLCKFYRISKSGFQYRKKQGWSLNEILTTPLEPKHKGVITDPFGNQFKTLKDMCEFHGIETSALYYRKHNGWDLEKILTTHQPKTRMIKNSFGDQLEAITDPFGNQFATINDMCEFHGIRRSAFYSRKKQGWPVKKILTTPCARGGKQKISDHVGNTFDSIMDLCRYYNMSPTYFHKQKAAGLPIEEIITKFVPCKKSITDPITDRIFPKINDLCRYYAVNKATFESRRTKRWSFIEAVGIVPHVCQKTKNADIIPNLRVLNHVCDNTYLAVHNGTETLMHYDEIIRFATEYFRQQHAATA